MSKTNDRIIYVVGYTPSSIADEFELRTGSSGGVEWRKKASAARNQLRLWMGIDANDKLVNEYVYRAVVVPPEVDMEEPGAVTKWLDTDGYDLWNLADQVTEDPQPAVSESEPWSDRVQFTRLLAEICACGLTDAQLNDLSASMDLPREGIVELLDRADKAFEAMKPEPNPLESDAVRAYESSVADYKADEAAAESDGLDATIRGK